MQVSRKFIIVGALLSVALLAAACGKVTPALDDKAAVGAVIDKWAAAELKEDVVGLAAVFANEVASQHEDGDVETRTRDEIVAQEQILWSEGTYTSFTSTNRVISISGSTASVTARLGFVFEPNEADETDNWEFKADVVITLSKLDGKWVISGLALTNIETNLIFL